jgi:hypothetical protein
MVLVKSSSRAWRRPRPTTGCMLTRRRRRRCSGRRCFVSSARGAASPSYQTPEDGNTFHRAAAALLGPPFNCQRGVRADQAAQLLHVGRTDGRGDGGRAASEGKRGNTTKAAGDPSWKRSSSGQRKLSHPCLSPAQYLVVPDNGVGDLSSGVRYEF